MATTRDERPVEAAAKAASRPGVRREGDREVPVGPKAQRTREALLKAAYELFVANGYIDTSVADITEAAGVSLGTFYQYFHDRSEVVGALLHDLTVRNLSRMERWRPEDGADGVYRVVHSFVSGYAEEADFAKVWEEVCHVDDHVAELRRDLGRVFTEAVEHALLRASRAGVIRSFTPRTAELAARALTGMVDRFCYVTFVFDPPAGDAPTPEAAARVLTDLWSAAIGLPSEARQRA
jgi:TetR/AcrR family transcriptional regulator, ethionamide resistance regulator